MSISPRVDFYRHALQSEDMEAVTEVLNTLILTTGPVTRVFEEKLADFLGRKFVVGVSNGTMALFLGLLACGVGEGDEVITTPMTFIASANAILHTGGTPVFVDVEPTTGNLDVLQVEAAITSKTKAVLPVHLYGTMVDMKPLRELCSSRGIVIVEDAAHALESEREDIRPGDLGKVGCFSFYATKNLTCGEGGAICTDDPDVYDTLMKLRLHGMSRRSLDRYSGTYQHWDMELLGYKSNLPDILSALMIHQVDRLELQVRRREEIAQRYEAAFSNIPGLSFPRVPEHCRSARHLFTIWVPEHFRDDALAALQERGIGVAVHFRAIHLLSYYRERFGFQPGSFPIAESIGHRTLSLPFYPGLRDEEIERVIQAVLDVALLWSS